MRRTLVGGTALLAASADGATTFTATGLVGTGVASSKPTARVMLSGTTIYTLSTRLTQ